MSTSRLVVRCFAEGDEGGLVDEWPVVVDEQALRTLVPETRGERIRRVEQAVAEQLIGRSIEAYPEPVAFYVEPEQIEVGQAP